MKESTNGIYQNKGFVSKRGVSNIGKAIFISLIKDLCHHEVLNNHSQSFVK
jgi:hypothetical protein